MKPDKEMFSPSSCCSKGHISEDTVELPILNVAEKSVLVSQYNEKS